MEKVKHEPVLLKEVVDSLHIKKQGRYIDATLGAGGYTIEILKKGGVVLGIDADPKMLEVARERLEIACPGSFFKLVNGNFRNIGDIAKQNGFGSADGIVFDLGISNIHFLSDERGFSFSDLDSDLDMRLDPSTQSVKASDLLNSLREDQLREMFGLVMDFKEANAISKAIVRKREQGKIEKVGDLLGAISFLKRKGKIHPATKTFLALRIAANSELENLEEALPKAYELLVKGGRVVIVTFNSLEQKVVRRFKEGKLLSKKGIAPGEKELETNPKSRSAIAYVIEKI